MPRPRNPENFNLPKRWQFTHEAYYYQVPPGLEKYWNHKRKFRLGSTLEEAMETFERMGRQQGDDSHQPDANLIPEDIAAKAVPMHKEGVYFLLSQDKIVYVGRSQNIYARIGQHIQMGRITFDRVHTVAATGLHQERLEQIYIAAFMPEYNGNGWGVEAI